MRPSGATPFLRSSAPWFGLLATAAAGIGLSSSVTPSPFLPVLPGGLEPAGWLTRAARDVGLDGLGPSAASLRASLLMGIAIVAFAALALAAWRGRVATGTAVVWSLILIGLVTLLPPLLSRDVYSYAIYGRIWAIEGANPYVHPPIEFLQDPFVGVVSAEWIRTPSVYGPAFTLLSGGVVKAFPSVAGSVMAFKALSGLALAATVVITSRLAERVAPGRGAFAAVAVGVNPVLLFHAVGGGHNDVFVGLAVAGALALWPRRALAATAVLTLGALVKIVGVVPLGLAMGAVVLRAGPGAGRRLRAVLPHVGVAAALAAVLFAPFGYSKAVLSSFATLTARLGWASPVRFLVRTVQQVGGGDGVVAAVRLGFTALGVLLLVAILNRVRAGDPRVSPAEAWGWGLLATTLCAAYLLPWYAAWFVPALVLTRRTAPVVVGLAMCALLATTAIPPEPAFAPEVWRGVTLSVHYVIAPITLGLLVALVLDLRRVLVGRGV